MEIDDETMEDIQNNLNPSNSEKIQFNTEP